MYLLAINPKIDREKDAFLDFGMSNLTQIIKDIHFSI